MKTLIAIISLFSISAASAADLGRTPPLYGGPAYEEPAGTYVNWTGLYVGGAIGYGNANHDLSLHDYFKDYCGDAGDDLKDFIGKLSDDDRNQRIRDVSAEGVFACPENGDGPGQRGYDNTLVPGDSREVATLDGLNSTGVVGDIRLGYDQQIGRFLVGIFGTYGFSGMEAEGAIAEVGGFKLERGDDWSVGARVGALLGERTLVYALAAYAETEYDLSVATGDSEIFNKNTNFNGVTVGGGLEHALTQSVFIGIEGTHTFYGDEVIFDNYNANENVGTRINDDLGETKVMGTIKIKLNSF